MAFPASSNGAVDVTVGPLVLLALGSFATFAAAAPECSAPGEPIQWIADYCMLKMETDDEIAVSGCIEEELKRSFPSSCASNVHFKRSLRLDGPRGYAFGYGRAVHKGPVIQRPHGREQWCRRLTAGDVFELGAV